MAQLHVLHLWSGIQRVRVGHDLTSRFHWGGLEDPPCDYDRACDVDDLVGVIQLGDTEVLVLSDEPLMTCWLPQGNAGAGTFARLRYADTIERVPQQLLAPRCSWSATDLLFETSASRLVLFDAALPGNRLRIPDEGLAVMLEAGRYEVASAEYCSDAHTAFALHHLSLSTRDYAG